MSVGERMKHIREQKGLNADQLAKKIGVSRSTIYRYEKGDIEKVPVEVISNIADALDVDLTYLMGIKNTDTANQINTVVSKLHYDRQKKVLNFAADQLGAQNDNAFIETLAAHQADSSHNINNTEANKISKYLDDRINKFNGDK
ncbi:helix-turn-helix domain-containing protein [Lactiplantibacillus paraxiangfangensis]|uniref:helix-turn-helix domain-containing protein n=1 Tax=Lactiplantibacillus paraxiangfangensis TaxID=3076224 RepID=UPI0030C77DD4